MRPMLFKKSWNLFYSNVVGRPVKFACFTLISVNTKIFKKTGINSWNRGTVMYRVSGLRLGPNFGLRLTDDKSFYLRLTVTKIHVLAVFTGKCLRSCGCSSTKFTAMLDSTNPKIEIQTKIIETQIIGIQSTFW